MVWIKYTTRGKKIIKQAPCSLSCGPGSEDPSYARSRDLQPKVPAAARGMSARPLQGVMCQGLASLSEWRHTGRAQPENFWPSTRSDHHPVTQHVCGSHPLMAIDRPAHLLDGDAGRAPQRVRPLRSQDSPRCPSHLASPQVFNLLPTRCRPKARRGTSALSLFCCSL